MAEPFATVQDVIDLFRELTPAEEAKTELLLQYVSDALRCESAKVDKDLDKMVEDSTAYGNVVKIVTVDVTTRILREDIDKEPMVQESQSALGYSYSGTYAVPGGGISNAIMNNDLKRLGLRRPRYGAVNVYGEDSWDNGRTAN